MSNSMKLILRSVIILLLMVAGSWLNAQLVQLNANNGTFGSVTFLVMYIVYLFIGLTLGSAVNPRFTKTKNKWIYFIPVLIFALIGAQWFFAPIFSVATLPWGIGNYLMPFSYLSWTIVGVFLSLAFR